ELLRYASSFNPALSFQQIGNKILTTEDGQALLEIFDLPTSQYSVSINFYEFTADKTSESAIYYLSKKFNYGGVLNNSILKITSSNYTLFLNQINGDKKFRQVANPSFSVLNNNSFSLNIGDEVPVLSSVSTSTTATQQSINYRPSGLIFNGQLTAFQNIYRLKYKIEVSSFSPTQTGVNTSPTLSKRLIEGIFDISPDTVVVLAGLKTEVLQGSKSKFFFIPISGSSKDQATELFLTVSIAPI
ncbi:MAG: hypothetical protein ORN54_00465, partial [Cyclobacteriaceae bacterium]|nr:hypothetical protein [Cyclobacteriaceae bacterium]